MNQTWERITVPDKIEVDGHIYRPNKAVLESLPADIVRELARRRMEQLKAGIVSPGKE
jgi:hypothetical protein